MTGKTMWMAALAATTMVASAMAQEAPLPEYRLDMKLYDGTTLVGEPGLVVSAWSASKIDIDRADGSRYRATFSVEPRDGNRLLFASRFDVASAAGPAGTAEPIVEIEQGKPTFVVFGLDSGDSKPFRAEVTIRAAGN